MNDKENFKDRKLSSDLIEEVSFVLEKLKKKLGETTEVLSTSLNYDSCEDFPPKNEVEVLTLIDKLQNTLDSIVKPDDSAKEPSGYDLPPHSVILEDLPSKTCMSDSNESLCNTPTVHSEDYEANSENSTNDEFQRPKKTSKYNKEIVTKTGSASLAHAALSSSVSHYSTDLTYYKNRIKKRHHDKDDDRSTLSTVIDNGITREDFVEQKYNGVTQHNIGTDSDNENNISRAVDRKRELPWKIRAAKKRMENIYKNEHYNFGNTFEFSKSTETIHFGNVPNSQNKYIHSKSAGNVLDVIDNHNSPLQKQIITGNSQAIIDENKYVFFDLLEKDKGLNSDGNLPVLTDESDSSNDEGDVFNLKPITANFLFQQEQVNKEKQKLPFEVKTNEVLKISEKFSKIDEGKPSLDKAPKKKIFGPIKNNVRPNSNVENSEVLDCKVKSFNYEYPSPKKTFKDETFPFNNALLKQMYKTVDNIETNDNIKNINKSLSNLDTNLLFQLNSIKNKEMTLNEAENIQLSNKRSHESGRYASKKNRMFRGQELSKSKSSPVCFKESVRSKKLEWKIFEDPSQSHTIAKPCFINKDKIQTNLVSDIHNKLEIGRRADEIIDETLTRTDELDENQLREICNDPSILLFTPDQLLKIAIHKAAINKQLSVDSVDKDEILLNLEQNFSTKKVLENTGFPDCGNFTEIPYFYELDNQLEDVEEDDVNRFSNDSHNVRFNSLEDTNNNNSSNIVHENNSRCLSETSYVENDILLKEIDIKPLYNYKDNISSQSNNLNSVPKSFVKNSDISGSSFPIKSISFMPNKYLKIGENAIQQTKIGVTDQILRQNLINNEMETEARPILEIQKKQNLIEDAASLVNSSVCNHKNKEDQVKRRNLSLTFTEPSHNQNSDVLQGAAQLNLLDQQTEIVAENLIKIEIPNSPNTVLLLSQEVSKIEKPTETYRDVGIEVTNNSDMYIDDRVIVENHKLINKLQSEQGVNGHKSKPLKKWNEADDSHIKVSLLQSQPNLLTNEHPHFPLKTNEVSSEIISTTPILSSSGCISPSKPRADYTDFIVPPLPTTTFKSSHQEESRSNIKSPTYLNSFVSGVFSSKESLNSQDLDKVNKVSDTWENVAKNNDVVISSKPWVKETNKTMKGQIVQKNKEKLLRNSETAETPKETKSISLLQTKVISSNKKMNYKNAKKILNYESLNSKVELKESTSTRVKEIKNKFKDKLECKFDSLIKPKLPKINIKNENKYDINSAHSLSIADKCAAVNGGKHEKTKLRNEHFNKIIGVFNENSSNPSPSPIQSPKSINKINPNSNFQSTNDVNVIKPSSQQVEREFKIIANNDNPIFAPEDKLGPTVNKLCHTSEAFKNISIQVHNNPSNKIEQKEVMEKCEKIKSVNLKQFTKWEDNIICHNPNVKTSWKIPSAISSAVKKAKTMLEQTDVLSVAKTVIRSNNEIKNVISSFESNKTEFSDTNSAKTHKSTKTSKSLIEKASHFQKKSMEPKIILRNSKSFNAIKPSAIEPFINTKTDCRDSLVRMPKNKDINSVRFKQIVENLETVNTMGKESNTGLFSRSKPRRNRPKSLYNNSANDKKCAILNQFSWNKEIGKLPNIKSNQNHKVIAEDKLRRIESFFQTTNLVTSKIYPANQPGVLGPKEAPKRTRIRSNSSSERSSLYDSWEHLVSNTDYNSQKLDEIFSETLLKDIELSDSSVSRRSNFSFDGNDKIEARLKPNLVRSKTFSHITYKGTGKGVQPFGNPHYPVTSFEIGSSSYAQSHEAHDKARETLLNFTKYDGSSSLYTEQQSSAYDALVNQSSYVGMRFRSSLDNSTNEMESNIGTYRPIGGQTISSSDSSETDEIFSDGSEDSNDTEPCYYNSMVIPKLYSPINHIQSNFINHNLKKNT